jgi:hypothetical protein
MTLTLGQGSVFEEGFDGTRAWSSDPVNGPRIETGRRAKEVARRADVHARARWATHFPERRTIGPTTFAGQPAWEIEVTTETGRGERHYFHRDTGRELGFVARISSALGELPFEASYADWREVAGVEMPFRVVNRVAEEEQVMTFTRIEAEAPPSDAFIPPPPVQSILEKKRVDAGQAPRPKNP